LYNSKKKGNGPNKLIKRCDEQAWIKNMYFFAARMLFKEKIWRANECLTSNTIALPARMFFWIQQLLCRTKYAGNAGIDGQLKMP